jgi:Major Facilitator Superfamily
MLWIGVLLALSIFYVRKFVKEPPIWLENRRRQRVEQREVHAPLISIFKPRVLGNTLTACLWLAGGFVAYYSVNALFATHLQKDLHLAPALVATPIFFANLGVFLAASGWGWWSDRWGRRWAIIIPALIALPLAPLYLLSKLSVDRGGFRRAGILRRRRHAWTDSAVLERTLPDRDTASFCFAANSERVLGRHVCCRRVCRCTAHHRQRDPGSRPHG